MKLLKQAKQQEEKLNQLRNEFNRPDIPWAVDQPLGQSEPEPLKPLSQLDRAEQVLRQKYGL